jgi:hypothetical protein
MRGLRYGFWRKVSNRSLLEIDQHVAMPTTVSETSGYQVTQLIVCVRHESEQLQLLRANNPQVVIDASHGPSENDGDATDTEGARR